MRWSSVPTEWGRAARTLGTARAFIFLASLGAAIALSDYGMSGESDCMLGPLSVLAAIFLVLTVSAPSAVMAYGILGRAAWSAWLALIGDGLFVLIILAVGLNLPAHLAYAVCVPLIAYTVYEWVLALRFVRSRSPGRSE